MIVTRGDAGGTSPWLLPGFELQWFDVAAEGQGGHRP
jgi:hypothetical protein